MNRPKLRNVEIIRVREDQFLLRDPLRYTEEILLVPELVLVIIALLDGSRTSPEIQYEFSRRYGAQLTGDKLSGIIDALDSNGFLEGEAFEKRRKGIDDGFTAAGVRPAILAGTGYEADAAALKPTLDALLDGIPSNPAGGTTLPLRGIIAPHIDIQRGSACYARSYAEIRRRNAARTVVLLGISHTETRNRFALTAKDFDTPFGPLKSDPDAVRKLAAACSFDPFEDEGAHRCEHSLEFQSVFLRHALPEADIRIVPVLCGAFLPGFYAEGSPAEDPQVSSFISGLRAISDERGEDVLFIAGADLCHIGRRFGDAEPFTEEFVSRARSADKEMLANVERMDAEGFAGYIQRERDKRKVCGFPAIYTLLSVLSQGHGTGGRCKGRVLSHEMAVDAEGESAVGFASVEISG
jgi:MEMO1 family protein